MIPGLSMASGGGAQSLDLSAGPSTSGNISQGGFNFGGPVVNSGADWKQLALIGAVVVAVMLVLKK